MSRVLSITRTPFDSQPLPSNPLPLPPPPPPKKKKKKKKMEKKKKRKHLYLGKLNFVAINVLSRQTFFHPDKSMLVAIIFLSQKHVFVATKKILFFLIITTNIFCCDKHNFVATNVSSRQLAFVATKHVFCRDKFCQDKNVLLRQT